MLGHELPLWHGVPAILVRFSEVQRGFSARYNSCCRLPWALKLPQKLSSRLPEPQLEGYEEGWAKGRCWMHFVTSCGIYSHFSWNKGGLRQGLLATLAPLICVFIYTPSTVAGLGFANKPVSLHVGAYHGFIKATVSPPTICVYFNFQVVELLVWIAVACCRSPQTC